MFPIDLFFTNGKEKMEKEKDQLEKQEKQKSIIQRLKKLEMTEQEDNYSFSQASPSTQDITAEEVETVVTSSLFPHRQKTTTDVEKAEEEGQTGGSSLFDKDGEATEVDQHEASSVFDQSEASIDVDQNEVASDFDQQDVVQKEEESAEGPTATETALELNTEEHTTTTEEDSKINAYGRKENNSLFSIISSLKEEKTESENKIKKLIDEKDKLKESKSVTTKELEKIKKENEDINSDIESLKKEHLKNEEEIEKLIEEKNNLYALSLKAEETNKVIQEMIELIGIETKDVGERDDPAYSENCLNRLKEEMNKVSL